MRTEWRPPGELGEYEALLIKEDRHMLWFKAIFVIGTVASSLFYDVDKVYVWASFMSAIFVVRALAFSQDLVGVGYTYRGEALWRALWWVLALVALYGVLWWVQSRYQLWFAQHEFTRHR